LATDIGKKYKKKAVKATVFVVGGYGFSQIIRLAGNLILTRLLVPEYFGLMALANVFYMGLHLFSDFGIAPGIIRSPRGYETQFLNTAWTLQVIRGFIIWVFSIIIAFPVAAFYKEPIFVMLIPVIGFNSILFGFQSTSLIVLQKELRQEKLTFIELIVQSVGLVAMIILAYIYRNVWALVIGGLVSSLIRTIWSHFLNTGKPTGFKFEKAAVKELLSFGKWIFVSTAMMFLATQADRLLLGKLFPLAFFGIYGIAVIFAEVPKNIISRISGSVIFPLLSKYSHLPPEDLRLKIRGQRKKMLIYLALAVSFFACFGDILILTLYDERYAQAAWILPLLAIGIWPLILYATIDRVLYVIGKSKYCAFGNLSKFIYIIFSVLLFYKFAGNFVAVLAIAINDIPVYIIINYGLAKEKLSLIKQDISATLVLILIIFSLISMRMIFGLGFPGASVFFAR